MKLQKKQYAAHTRRVATSLLVAALVLAGVGLVAMKPTLGTLFQPQQLLSDMQPMVPSSVTTQAQTTDGGHAYGFAAGSSLPHLKPAALDTQLRDIAATGATWIRFDISWSIVQPKNSSQFSWATYDTIVAAAQKYHLSILGIIDYTPQWARASSCPTSDKCQPKDPNQFGTFAAAVASHYAPMGVHSWEIWNEPNSPLFWQPKASPSTYAKLLKAAYQGIHHVDASAIVVTGGLAPQTNTEAGWAPLDFMAELYHNGAKPYFDAIGDHPYTFPQSPTDDMYHAWNQMAAPLDSLRQLLVYEHDSNKKIWVTEFGAPTNGPDPKRWVSESEQATILQGAINLYRSYNWVGPFFWYSYKDAGTATTTNENFYGLVRGDGSTKPALSLFKQAIKP